MTRQGPPAYVPQCPECGLPMHIARIVPALADESEETADNYVYECLQGHEVIKRIERKN